MTTNMNTNVTVNEIALELSSLHRKFVKDEERKMRGKINKHFTLSVNAKVATSVYERYKRKYTKVKFQTNRRAMKLELLRKESKNAEKAFSYFDLFVVNENQWPLIDGLGAILKEFAPMLSSIKISEDVAFAVVVLQSSEHHKEAVKIVVRAIREWETKNGL